jgi:mRNA-degrading endonuclease toxin of MazEF toxin-antitoxin module
MISAGVVTVLKLNAGFSRKVGEPDFGSRGASVNVELELDSNLIRDSEAFCAQIRNPVRPRPAVRRRGAGRGPNASGRFAQ